MIRNKFSLNSAFDKQKFVLFLRDFLPDDFTTSDKSLALPFSPKYVTDGISLGTCRSLELEVFLVKHTSSHDARVGISKELFRMLCANSMYNRALVVSVPEGSSTWRLSLLQMEISQDDNSARVRYDYSNPRRHSFLLGEGAKTKTPEEFLFNKGKLHERKENKKQLSVWDDLVSRFSVESLTKEFYDRLYHWYQWAVEVQTPDSPGVTFPNNPETADDDKDNLNVKIIRLITRLLFVWFIKQKGLVPNSIFDYKSELKDILRDFDYNSDTEGNYYNAILQNLFFATLNNEIDKRSFCKDSYKGTSSSYGVKTVYRDSSKASWFKISHDEVLEMFKTVPYMNCGLFECLDKVAKSDINTPVDMLLDGFSSRDAKQRDPKTGKENYKYRAFIPNALFFGEERTVQVMVEEKKGKKVVSEPKPVKVEGIIRLFEEYNFTVEENTPSDVQVSLDPELLGRVFENLLAAYNPETKENARKSTGSFYTPRPIVEYMVNESLVQYLKTKVIGGEQLEPELRKLISYKDEEIDIPEVQRRDILHCIYTCKVLDPACGSGAFPMGMLQQMVHIMRRIDPDNKIWHDVVLEQSTREMMEAMSKEKDKAARHERMAEIEEEFDDDLTNADYKRKLYLIRNCIYGVDIQPIAMLISKLRFFISLVCEQNPDMTTPEKNYGINTLPNLETKFVAANTLIPASIRNFKEGLFSDSKLAKLKDELLEIRMRHFQVKTQKSKQANRERDGVKRDEIKDYLLHTASIIDEELIKTNKALIAQYEKELKKYEAKVLVEEAMPLQTTLFGFDTSVTTRIVDRNKRKRDELKSCIKVCKAEIAREENKRNLPEFEAAVKEITQWNPYDQVNASPFFDPEWMFGVEGGFDIVIANPPYINANDLKKMLGEVNYKSLKELFETSKGTVDYYVYFFEKGIKALKKNGILTFITPNKYLCANYAIELRKYFIDNIRFVHFWDISDTHCFTASVYPIVTLLQNWKDEDEDYTFTVRTRINSTIEYKSDVLVSLSENIFGFILSDKINIINKIIPQCQSLTNVCSINATSTAKEADDYHSYISDIKENGIRIVNTGTIDPYVSLWGNKQFVDQGTKLLCPYLLNDISILGEYRYGMYNSSKIIIAKMSNQVEAVLDERGLYASINTNCLHTFKISPQLLLGWIHSKVFNFVYEVFFDGLRMSGGYLPYTAPYLSCMFVPCKINSIEKLVVPFIEEIISLRQKDVNKDISTVSHKIDAIFYKLLEFSYEEISEIDSEFSNFMTEFEYKSFTPDEL